MKKLLVNPIALILVLLFFPIAITMALFHYYSEMKELNEIHAHLIAMQSKVDRYHLLKEKENTFFAQIENGSPTYIELTLEPLTFLNTEAKKLQALSNYVKEDPHLEERLAFITSQNHLKLTEKETRNDPQVKETELKLANPLQIDLDDLKSLLSKIETAQNKAPVLIFKHFDLIKKEISKDSQIFEIDFELIKREKNS